MLTTPRLIPLLALLSLVFTIGAAQPSDSIWSTRAQLLEPYSEIAVAEVNGKIYVLGGYPSTRRYVDTVQVYDPALDTWESSVPLPQPMHHTVAIGVDGVLYVLGGEISDNGLANQGIYIDTVYAFDPSTATWTQKASMPTARSAGGAAVVDGKIYVAGGRPPHGSDFAMYDPIADAWTVLPNLPTQRNHLAVGALDGKVYVFGGRFGGSVGSEMTDIVEVFDPATGAWARAASMLSPRAGLNGVTARGCFYSFGGEGNASDPRGIFEQNEVYDPRTDSWMSLEPIPTPVHGVTGAAYVGGWIHLPGGGISRGGNSGSRLHQVFQPAVDCEGG
jgi:N-acetylneuraminic acid mutarotase